MKLFPRLVGILPHGWTAALVRARWRYPWLQPFVAWGASTFKDQDGVIQKGLGKGLRFNSGYSAASYLLGSSELGVQAVLDAVLRPASVFYDIGANVGFHTVIAARKVGIQGSVVCFEPVPDIQRLLAHNIRINGFTNVVVRHEALGAENGFAPFLVSAKSAFGTLASVGVPPAEQIGEIDVVIRQLDSLLDEAAIPDPMLMKIDVEGAEIDVLVGAARTIERARPFLIIELHNNNTAVAHWIANAAYQGVVLGESVDVTDAHWNSVVLAAPRERPDLVSLARHLSSTPVGMK